MTDAPLVTVVLPARNEAADIGRAVEHVLAQDHPADRLELLVIDGASTDGTGGVATALLERSSGVRWKVLRNSEGTTPSNLNQGLAIAQGEFLCRVDARSLIPPHYVRTCAEVLASRPDVAVVGGAQVTVVRDDTTLAKGIARALNNKYGMGFSRYRRGASSGPTDTVYLGAFRTAQLRGVRGWDERLLSNQDFELNRRLGKVGMVWFDDRLDVGYVPRRRVGELFRQYHRFGRWKVRYWRETGDRPRPRQVALLLSPILGLGGAAALRRSIGTAPTAAAMTIAALGVEAAGSRGPAELPTRATAVAALGAVAGGWLSGIAAEALGRST